jgi:hypothetical protein
MSETRPSVEANASPGHEVRDADIRSLTYLGFGILALIVFGFIVAELALHFFVGRQPIKNPTALFVQQQTPPPPLIQEHSGEELQDYLKQQNQILNSYGWVDRKAGIVRIPIDQAMDLLLQKGLPVRQPGQVTKNVSAPHTLPRGDFGPPGAGVQGPQPQ